MKFFGIGYSKMTTIEKSVKDGGLTPTPHGLSDRHGNAAMNCETKASLQIFLKASRMKQNRMPQKLYT